MAQHKLWPTPNVPNGGRTTWHAEQEGNSFYHNGKKVQFGLEQAVRMWPTPRVMPGNSSKVNGKEYETSLQSMARKGLLSLTDQSGGQLNPVFVEWLMGWPLGWSDLKPLATDGSPTALWPHGTFSPAL
jgi:hypothetical protein